MLHHPPISAKVKAIDAGATIDTLGLVINAFHISPCRRWRMARVVPQAGQGNPVAERNGHITIFVCQTTFSNSQATPVKYKSVAMNVPCLMVNLEEGHQFLKVLMARSIHNEEEVDDSPQIKTTASQQLNNA